MRIRNQALAILCLLSNFVHAVELPTTLPTPTKLPTTTLPNPLPQAVPLGLPPIISTQPLQPNLTPTPQPNDFNLNFNNISLSNLSTVIFTEILQKNFVLSPKVIQDERLVSFRYNRKSSNLESYLVTFYKDMGYSLSLKNGTYYLDIEPQKKSEDYFYQVYQPKYRTVNYLADVLRPYFQEAFLASNKQIQTENRVTTDVSSSTSALASIDKSQEILTFRYENDKLKNRILDMLSKIDSPNPNLVAKAYIYEVSYDDNDGSALGLMLNLASKKLNIQLGSTSPLDNFVKFSSNTLNLFLSNIEKDSKVRLVSNPLLRISNGKESSFTVGQSVPTLSNITTTATATQQSVSYVDTGLIFKITPTITRESVQVNLTQEISEASVTDTGVNNSPTLTKRNLTSVFSTKKNEVVMLAGLTQNKTINSTTSTFFLPFLSSNNKQNVKTDIVIFIQILDTTSEEIPSLEESRRVEGQSWDGYDRLLTAKRKGLVRVLF